MIKKLFVILILIFSLTSCSIRNPDYEYIYNNKCILTGNTSIKEDTNYIFITIDSYGTAIPIPYDDSYTIYEYECLDHSLQWSSLKYDITQSYKEK